MNYAELQDEIEILVDPQDDEHLASIPTLVNEAIAAVTQWPGIVVPSLKTIVSINTTVDQAYTTLPQYTNPDGEEEPIYNKILYAVSGEEPIPFHFTLEDMMDMYGSMDTEGDVEAVALEGQNIWYAHIPTVATAIALLLYKTPDLLTEDEDVCTVIPAHLHRHTIVRYAAWTLFDKIEQAEDGAKANTAVQKNFFEEGMSMLMAYLGARRRGQSKSVWNV